MINEQKATLCWLVVKVVPIDKIEATRLLGRYLIFIGGMTSSGQRTVEQSFGVILFLKLLKMAKQLGTINYSLNYELY
jgi:hypothetical protein